MKILYHLYKFKLTKIDLQTETIIEIYLEQL